VGFNVKELPERPLECTECRRKVAYTYTEIVGGVVTQACMCKECPILEQKLRGANDEAEPAEGIFGKKGGLCCGNCGTTLEGVRMGHPLGCPQCYEVFEDILSEELARLETSAAGKNGVVHKGRSPGETIKVSPAIRLLALNEALNEMLSREDYEQAAQIRDQIKELENEQKQEGQKDGK
jgi:protein arginine kinase activator